MRSITRNGVKEIQRKITLTLPQSELRLLTDEAAKRDTSVAAMLREWIAPHVIALKNRRTDQAG